MREPAGTQADLDFKKVLIFRKKYLQSEGKFDRIIKSFGETPENEGKNNFKNFLTNT